MPPGAQHPGDLVHRPLVVGDVLEHLGRDHPVERAVGERHRGGVPGHRPACRPRRRLAGLVHRGEHGGDLVELVQVAVQRDHVRAAPQRLERVPPAPQPRSSTRVARPDHGQAGRSRPVSRGAPAPCRLRRARRSPRGTAATVARATADQANRSWTRRSAAAPSRSRSAGLSQQPAQRGGELLGVARLDQHGGVAGRPRAARRSGCATSGVPEAMCSTAGSEKPSYSEGTTAISALASELGQLVVADAVHGTAPGRPAPSSPASRSVGPPGVGLLTTTRRACGALGPSSLAERAQQRGHALHRRVRAGHRHDQAGHAGRGPRVEQPGVHAERDDLHAVGDGTEVAGRCRRREDCETVRIGPRTEPGARPGPASGRRRTSAAWTAGTGRGPPAARSAGPR